jgi:diguanylate cyclase (GGDEF)-like protein
VVAKNQVRELRALALQDSLTGLANRRALLKALVAATTSPRPDGLKDAFFLIDLNNFKRVNDLHGHALGDRVLQVITERFRTVARPSDVLARLGGDEFAVLSYNVDRDTAHSIGLRFIASLQSEIQSGGQSHEVSASIGAALIPDDGTTAEVISPCIEPRDKSSPHLCSPKPRPSRDESLKAKLTGVSCSLGKSGPPLG